MSILIKGMKMPKNCVECKFFVKSDSPKYPFVDCVLIGRLGSVFNAISIPVDCPLVPVPPHGRLIDADAFAENLKNVSIRQGYKDTLIGESLSVDDVIDAIIADLTGKALCGFELNPTIIPADKGETE